MLVGVGIDLVHVPRVERELERDARGLVRALAGPEEIAGGRSTGRGAACRWAARFAAKEACLKALGTGARDAGAWREVVVRGATTREPRIVLRGGAAAVARALGVRRVRVALACSAEWALAGVTLES